MLVIADTSPLRYLIAIDAIEVLPALFQRVIAPSAVIEELTRSSTPATVRAVIESCPSWLEVQAPMPHSLSEVSGDLDIGERAALALALELRADLVLVDDAAGRRCAKLLGLELTGTLGVLILAAERELLDLKVILPRLQRSGFYVSEKVLRAALGTEF